MSDITMCPGIDCPLKSACKRYTTKPHEFRQAYFLEPPYEKTDTSFKCDLYWGDQAEAVWKDLKNAMGIETSD